jgi:hypothetical protein
VQGTTFVLQKSADPRQILLSTISAKTGVEEVCDLQLASSIVTLNGENYVYKLSFWLNRSSMILFQAKMEQRLI